MGFGVNCAVINGKNGSQSRCLSLPAFTTPGYALSLLSCCCGYGQKSCHDVVWALRLMFLHGSVALFFFTYFVFISCSNISMLEETGWRKPSWRRALIWNLSNTLSAFILNLQMPWSRNIYAPKPLKVSGVASSGAQRCYVKPSNITAQSKG